MLLSKIRLFRIIKCSAVLIGGLVVIPFCAGATDEISVRLYQKSQSGAVIELREGSPILSGSKIRLLVSAPYSGKLAVKFYPVGGISATTLLDKQAIDVGTVLLPSADGWFDTSEKEGRASFAVSLDAGHSVYKTSVSFFQVGLIRDDAGVTHNSVSSEAAPFAALGDKNPTTLDKVGKAKTSAVAATALKLLDSINNNKGVALRGPAGAKIFRDFSKSVVLIVSEDGIGSGVVISDKGDIVTNYHVVNGAEQLAIIVKPEPGEKIKEKDIYIGVVDKVDEVRDLAHIKAASLPKDIKAVPFGTLDKIEVGGDVHAIGHPTGESWTYTQGIVSQIRAGYKWATGPGVEHEATVIQTQTPINPGNSGGPLFDDSGTLIGINSFVKKNAQGLNYAVSIRDVTEFLSQKKSRMAKKSNTRENQCEPKGKTFDTNGNGKPDTVKLDTDCNGKIDTIIIDNDENGIPDIMLVDTDENGKPDMKLLKSKPEGPFDIWLKDVDEDGKPDLVGIDTDGDGKPDKFKKLS